MLLRVLALSAALLAGTVAPADASTRTVSVDGAVATPASYTASQLKALGGDLNTLVGAAAPVLPPGKNTALRVTVTVTGSAHRAVTFALAELDPAFGNHPAVLTTDHGIDLVVRGDRDRSRSVRDVREMRVAVSAATAAERALRITTAHRSVTLPPWLLTHLPSRAVTASFGLGTGQQTHTETGPSLALVLRIAGVVPRADTAVVAVGSDGYGAAVTLAEERTGGRPLLLSTVEDGVPLDLPRLVPLGDVKGGRYVSGVTALDVH
ncbi:hypothetical protein SAMN05421837_112124 [Amycolatopsis pretoriensis]|uniref:Oxidoreductase molybdopterin binding domain-containing protein n=1 Tax=Amycolatopsis pretoriensis TaxID=218821 RepID=A0A1H5RF70_9PSEU|nr:hypothetical protein [Amycolatopsis pretoriensis]SEF37013.1 hypothetical protein SAMN05421837_112124 [Amycolatopsis pretoriensis]